MIRDLTEVAFKMVREDSIEQNQSKAKDKAESRILDILLPPRSGETEEEKENSSARQLLRKQLREGKLDDREIEVDVAKPNNLPGSLNIIGAGNMDDMSSQLSDLFSSLGQPQSVRQTMKVKDAFKALTEEEADRMSKVDDLKTKAVDLVENCGIVFIDEIDKICQESRDSGQVSRQGVQRDLLPLIEGSTVQTKYGMVRTDHILFIASGAFQMSKPSDLIPELQGRLPIRVELKALTAEDFERILTEPHNSLVKQYELLLKTEEVTVHFDKGAVRRIAEDAFKVNERTENIGARRLHTLMERILEDLSFSAPEKAGTELTIDEKYVDDHLGDLVENEDLSRYIL